MKTVRSPFFFRWFNSDYLVCDFPKKEKVIYLTFDDGPVPEVTPITLEILRKYEAKATFFLVGDNVRKYPQIFDNLIAEGHSIGNHTFHHLNGWQTPPGAYLEDVTHCDEFFSTHLFRPPYGRFTPTQYLLLRKKFRFVLWSVLTNDFNRNTSPEECLDLAIRNTKSGSIVVFHDSLKALEKMRYALPRFLEHFYELGYSFTTIPD
ncbi:MAG: polysaccharide deacetylase family protein [Bacteroidales bacterium]|nr:polysaccharide deacetylase family protein [Bacteroidales bacterium]